MSASGGEPALESDVSSRDEVERVERGHKRQAVQTPATTRRCPVRQSPRNLAAALRSSQRESVDEESCSLLLNKIPTELLENMLSCEFWPITLIQCIRKKMCLRSGCPYLTKQEPYRSRARIAR